MLSQKVMKGKWSEIKDGIRNIWGNVTDEELEETKGSLQAIAKLIEDHNEETKESIKIKIETLMESFDNETDKSLKLNDGISSYQRDPRGFSDDIQSIH